MRERVDQPEEGHERAQAAGPAFRRKAPLAEAVLRLQRAIGNRATRAVLQRDPRHDRGYAGEQGAGFHFYRYDDGWAVLRGPGGSAGHGVTRPGEDGLMFNVRTKELHIVDNKSLKAEGNVSSATAIDPQRNLRRNLRDMIRYVRGQSLADLPMRQEVLSRLTKTWAAIDDGRKLPARVSLVVTNYGGRSSGVTERLANQGVTFRDVNDPLVVRPAAATPSITKTPTTQSLPTTTPPPARTTAGPAKFTIPPPRFGRFRVGATRAARGVAGVGLGALISYLLGMLFSEAVGETWMKEQTRFAQRDLERAITAQWALAVSLETADPGWWFGFTLHTKTRISGPTPRGPAQFDPGLPSLWVRDVRLTRSPVFDDRKRVHSFDVRTGHWNNDYHYDALSVAELLASAREAERAEAAEQAEWTSIVEWAEGNRDRTGFPKAAPDTDVKGLEWDRTRERWVQSRR